MEWVHLLNIAYAIYRIKYFSLSFCFQLNIAYAIYRDTNRTLFIFSKLNIAYAIYRSIKCEYFSLSRLNIAQAIGFVAQRFEMQNAFPDSEAFDKNSIKALDLIDDLHFYQKLHNFYLSDEKNTLVLGKCYVLVGVGKDVSINLYKIELRLKNNNLHVSHLT